MANLSKSFLNRPPKKDRREEAGLGSRATPTPGCWSGDGHAHGADCCAGDSAVGPNRLVSSGERREVGEPFRDDHNTSSA